MSSPPMMNPNTTPAAKNPYEPNYRPNFSNPETRAPLAIGFCSLALGVMVFFVSLRIYSRARISKRLGWDDWSCILAALLVAASTGAVIAACTTGALGPHMWDIPLAKFTSSYFTRLYVAQVLSPISLFMVKLSLLLLYLEIFRPNKATRIAIWAGIGFLAAYHAAALIATTVLCTPRPEDKGRLHKDCSTKGIVQSTVTSGINIGTDLYILAIPIPIVWKLQMSRKRKFGVTLVLLTGLLATVCSCIAVAYRAPSMQSVDSSWTLVPPIIAGAMEANIGVVCACLPCLPAFWRHAVIEKNWSVRGLLSRISGSFRTERSEIPGYASQQSFKGGFGGVSDESVLGPVSSFRHSGSMEMGNRSVQTQYAQPK